MMQLQKDIVSCDSVKVQDVCTYVLCMNIAKIYVNSL